MRRYKLVEAITGSAVAVAALTGCALAPGGDGGSNVAGASNRGLPQGGETVRLDPAAFTTRVTNPYFPLKPGSRWVYSETDTEGGKTRVVVVVTNRTKRIANGVVARVVRDTASEKGVPVEVTDDWYAQDKAGNVWYLGEKTATYANGRLKSTKGSFEAGVDGAQAGIAMPANPRPGLSYRQEYYKGIAEDKGAIVTVGKEHAEVPAGYFARKVLMTRDLEPTEPRVQELKFYAPGIGNVLSLHTDGAGERSALVSYTPGK